MSFSLKKKQPLKDIAKKLKKLIQPKYYDLLNKRVGGAPQIGTFGEYFIPVLVRWSFEAFFRFCVEQGVFSAIGEGKTVKELLYDLKWKNEGMLEDLLDIFVDQEYLRKQGREYRPSANPMSSESVMDSILNQFGLKETDKQWIEQSTGYRIIFSFYNKLISSFLLESMITGRPTTTLKGSTPSRLGMIFDGLLNTPAYAIPRMAAVAYAVAKRNPKVILDLNCSTGRGTEEILSCQPNAELILGVDSSPYQLEIAQRNVELRHATNDIQKENVTFREIDYSKSIQEQLNEFTGIFDMILINQLPSWISHETYSLLIPEIWNLLRPDGVIAVYQPLRPSIDVPWPDEWLLRVIEGFCGFPNKTEFLKQFSRRSIRNTSTSVNRQTVVPILSYVFYT